MAPKQSVKALISNPTRRTERVFLVGVELKSGTGFDVRDSLEELTELAVTAGGTVVGTGLQKLESPVAATFLGPGKPREFADPCLAQNIHPIIFDD